MRFLHWPLMGAVALAIPSTAQTPFALDPSFRTNINAINVRSVLPVEDDKIIVSGQAYFGTSTVLKAGGRLFADGTQDLSFAPVPNMGGKLVRWQDKIYASNGNGVRRLTMDGYIDPSFISLNSDPLFSSLQGADYHVYPDGRLLISGLHNLYDTTHGFVGYYTLIWFTNTGHVDTTQHHRWSNGSTDAIAQLPDGKFMLSCVCTTYEGQPASRVLRVHPDGALDNEFYAGVESGVALTYLGLPDGRVYAGGDFTIAGHLQRYKLVRFMPDGSLDPSFDSSLAMELGTLSGIQPIVTSITPLDGGRLLLTGGFQTVNGLPRSGLCMVDTTGQLLDDLAAPGCDTFTYQTFTYGSLDGVVFDANNGMYIYGAYHGYNDGTTSDPLQRQVTRLFAPDLTTGLPVAKPASADELSIYPNPASAWVACNYHFVNAPENATIRIVDLVGKPVDNVRLSAQQGQVILDTRSLAPGAYMAELWNAGAVVQAERLIVQ